MLWNFIPLLSFIPNPSILIGVHGKWYEVFQTKGGAGGGEWGLLKSFIGTGVTENIYLAPGGAWAFFAYLGEIGIKNLPRPIRRKPIFYLGQ